MIVDVQKDLKSTNEYQLGIWSTLLDSTKGIYDNWWNSKVQGKKNKYLQELIEKDKKEQAASRSDFAKYLPIVGIGAAALILMRKRK